MNLELDNPAKIAISSCHHSDSKLEAIWPTHLYDVGRASHPQAPAASTVSHGCALLLPVPPRRPRNCSCFGLQSTGGTPFDTHTGCKHPRLLDLGANLRSGVETCRSSQSPVANHPGSSPPPQKPSVERSLHFIRKQTQSTPASNCPT